MIGQYVQAIGASFEVVLSWISRLALPLALLLGLLALAAGISVFTQKDGAWIARYPWNTLASKLIGSLALSLVFVACWSGLRAVLPIAREDLAWRESAEATTNPVPDAPAAYQYGPSVASMVEKTYSRTLNLPPDFLQRIGEQGVGVLAPYLTDPSAENVLKVADTFRRSGQDVVFTRSVTRLDEEPIPISKSEVRVEFHRLAGRAYDAEFEGKYVFQNNSTNAIDARFMFPLPTAGTLRDLRVTVGDQKVPEPNGAGSYEWTGSIGPGEQREANISYRVMGAKAWHYDLGSRRRRVEDFRLEVLPGGPVRYLRGSIQPTATTGSSLQWDLANVITAQQVALAIPPESEGRESYLQAVSALPASLVLFAMGTVFIGFRMGRTPPVSQVTGALALFALGLGASVVLANYLGQGAAIAAGPLLGALGVLVLLGPKSLTVSVPAALVPAAFISPQHSGLIMVTLVLLASAGIIRSSRLEPRQERSGPG